MSLEELKKLPVASDLWLSALKKNLSEVTQEDIEDLPKQIEGIINTNTLSNNDTAIVSHLVAAAVAGHTSSFETILEKHTLDDPNESKRAVSTIGRLTRKTGVRVSELTAQLVDKYPESLKTFLGEDVFSLDSLLQAVATGKETSNREFLYLKDLEVLAATISDAAFPLKATPVKDITKVFHDNDRSQINFLLGRPTDRMYELELLLYLLCLKTQSSLSLTDIMTLLTDTEFDRTEYAKAILVAYQTTPYELMTHVENTSLSEQLFKLI